MSILYFRTVKNWKAQNRSRNKNISIVSQPLRIWRKDRFQDAWPLLIMKIPCQPLNFLATLLRILNRERYYNRILKDTPAKKWPPTPREKKAPFQHSRCPKALQTSPEKKREEQPTDSKNLLSIWSSMIMPIKLLLLRLMHTPPQNLDNLIHPKE